MKMYMQEPNLKYIGKRVDSQSLFILANELFKNNSIQRYSVTDLLETFTKIKLKIRENKDIKLSPLEKLFLLIYDLNVNIKEFVMHN
jgi:hypothetical protein